MARIGLPRRSRKRCKQDNGTGNHMEQTQWGWTLDRWNQIFDSCAYTLKGMERAFDVSLPRFYKWLNGEVIPNDKSKKKMEEILMRASENKRIPYSPIWGYATPEQIEKLKGQITEQARERIMEQIKKQTRLGGKVD